MTDKERQIYKKRIIIENRFSWLDYLRTVALIDGTTKPIRHICLMHDLYGFYKHIIKKNVIPYTLFLKLFISKIGAIFYFFHYI